MEWRTPLNEFHLNNKSTWVKLPNIVILRIYEAQKVI